MPGKGARRTRLGWDIGKRPVGCGIIISRASAASIKDSINKENGGTNGKEKTSVNECFFYYRTGAIKRGGAEAIDKKVIIFIRQKV